MRKPSFFSRLLPLVASALLAVCLSLSGFAADNTSVYYGIATSGGTNWASPSYASDTFGELAKSSPTMEAYLRKFYGDQLIVQHGVLPQNAYIGLSAADGTINWYDKSTYDKMAQATATVDYSSGCVYNLKSDGSRGSVITPLKAPAGSSSAASSASSSGSASTAKASVSSATSSGSSSASSGSQGQVISFSGDTSSTGIGENGKLNAACQALGVSALSVKSMTTLMDMDIESYAGSNQLTLLPFASLKLSFSIYGNYDGLSVAVVAANSGGAWSPVHYTFDPATKQITTTLTSSFHEIAIVILDVEKK